MASDTPRTIPCRWCNINAGTAHLSECPVGQIERERDEARRALRWASMNLRRGVNLPGFFIHALAAKEE
jgi:hypothetical protein